MLITYFSEVEKLSDDLKRQIVLNLKRTLNIARKEPTVLVTTLRIIEREEKADEAALQRNDTSGFLPPGRPKQWRQMAFDILEAAVTERLEASQLESRKENKMWLVRYLEVMRLLMLEDLSVIKSLCVPCFPPSYGILERYVSMYHNCLAKLVCIKNMKAMNYDCISLYCFVLSWKNASLENWSSMNLYHCYHGF
jgi:exocyst complex component 3